MNCNTVSRRALLMVLPVAALSLAWRSRPAAPLPPRVYLPLVSAPALFDTPLPWSQIGRLALTWNIIDGG